MPGSRIISVLAELDRVQESEKKPVVVEEEGERALIHSGEFQNKEYTSSPWWSGFRVCRVYRF